MIIIKNNLTIVFVLMISLFAFTVNADDYTLDGDKVYIKESDFYISAEPHTYTNPDEYIYANISVAKTSGSYTLLAGFSDEDIELKDIEIYNPTTTVTEESYTCNYDLTYDKRSSSFSCTREVPEETVYTSWYNETDSGYHEDVYEAYNVTLFSHSYNTINTKTQTMTWNETTYTEWDTYSSSTDSRISYSASSLSKWDTTDEISLTAGTDYILRFKLDSNLLNLDGKYWICLMPSSYGTDLTSASSGSKLYCLDPWYNLSREFKVDVLNNPETNFPYLLNGSGKFCGDPIRLNPLDGNFSIYYDTAGEICIDPLIVVNDTILANYHNSTDNITEGYNPLNVFGSNVRLALLFDYNHTNISGTMWMNDSSDYNHNAFRESQTRYVEWNNTDDWEGGQGSYEFAYLGNQYANMTKLVIPWTQDLNVTDEFTIAAWIKPKLPHFRGSIVASCRMESNPSGVVGDPNRKLFGWVFGRAWGSGDVFPFLVRNSSYEENVVRIPGFFTNNTDTWQFVTGTFKANEGSWIYHNGTLMGEVTNTTCVNCVNITAPVSNVVYSNITDANCSIGSRSENYNGPWNGSIGEVWYIAEKLEQEDIMKWYNSTKDQYLTLGSEQWVDVDLDSPSDGSIDYDGNITFVCNASTSPSHNITNVTLYHNINQTFGANITVITTGTNVSVEFNVTDVSVGTYLWNCRAETEDGGFDSGNINWTIHSDTPRNLHTFRSKISSLDAVNITSDGYVKASSGYYVDEEQGITDSSSYWLCTDAACSATCQVDINGGIIVGCT